MIVRGTVLSDKRVPLDGTGPPRSNVPPVRTVTTPPPTAELWRTNENREPAQTSEPPIAPPAAVMPPVPPPLSLDRVTAWIATQDEATRAALAIPLAGDLEELKRSAYEQGQAAGHEAGQADADAEMARHLEILASISRAAQAALEAESATLSEQCAEIVSAALTRIAGPLLTTREAALGAVLEVLKRLTEEREIVVRVSAADLAVLRASEDRIAAALAGRTFSIVADTRVEGGGAIVESSLGTLDGRLEVQLRALADTVLAVKAAHWERR